MERPLIKFNQPNAVLYIICNGHAVCGVIVDALDREAEAGHLVHGLAVVIIPAVITPGIKRPDRRRVLLYAGQLGHVRRGLLMALVNAETMLRPEDTVHIIRVFVSAVVGFGTPHLYLMLQDLCYHPGLGAALAAAVENPVVDVHIMAIHISDGHTQAVAAAPGHVIHETDVIPLSVRQHAIIIIQAIRGECKPLFFYAMLHEQTFKIRAVNGGLDVPDFLGRISVRVVILKIAYFILIPDRDSNEAIARIVSMVRLHAACMAIGVPTDCSCK